jgi:hypothetical protein
MIEQYIPKFMDILYEDDIKSRVTFNELRDEFHTNQIVSITDAIIGFSKLPKTTHKNVLYIGSWFGVLTRFLCDQYPNFDFSQLDYDSRLETVSKRFLLNVANHKNYFICDALTFDKFSEFTTVINLSTEHMNDSWFDLLPTGTEVVMQSNNFNIHDHVNLCHNMDEMKKRFPLDTIYYENSIELNVYTRFTLVGRK